jgi:dTDP-4-amino-4,6-dideoxygalactose transaminase
MKKLAGLPIILTEIPSSVSPAWHLFVIRHANRDKLMSKLVEQNIGTMIHYPIPPHLQPAYAHLDYPVGSFPKSEMIHRDVLSLPIGPTMTEAQVGQVIDAVKLSA